MAVVTCAVELADVIVPPLLVPLPVLVVPFPEEGTPLVLLPLDVELLGAGVMLLVPVVVLALDTGPNSGPPDSVEQEKRRGRTACNTAERSVTEGNEDE